jgi:hypothetical protein
MLLFLVHLLHPYIDGPYSRMHTHLLFIMRRLLLLLFFDFRVILGKSTLTPVILTLSINPIALFMACALVPVRFAGAEIWVAHTL